MRKENDNNQLRKATTAFNRSILFKHVINEPRTVKELAKAMYTSEVLAWEHCKWLEANNFVSFELIEGKRQSVKKYSAINVEKYTWSKKYLSSKDPFKDYFDVVVYPHVHQSLRDAIYEGRISGDIVKMHKRAGTVAWDLKYKKDYHGNFQSSMNGEYFV